MKPCFHKYCLVPSLIWILMGGLLWAEGEGQLRFGYVYSDEDGNLGVNHETYNIYEGASISLENFRYITDRGFVVNGDLKNMTLNNRDLRASVFMPGRVGLSLYNHQYRRIYDFNGDKFTRRRSSGAQIHFSPSRYLKIFGGYDRSDKHGEILSVKSPIEDSVIFSSNYTLATINVGAEAFYKKRKFRWEYCGTRFSDDEHTASDREADRITVSGFTPVPSLEWIALSGGYRYRRDLHTSSDLKLITNQAWAATRFYLPSNMIADYRLMVSRTEQTERIVEIDNYYNTIVVSRSWLAGYGLRVGYENRINDDVLNRTVLHVLLAGGWYRYQRVLFIRARMSISHRNVEEGYVIFGDEDLIRFEVSARYSPNDRIDLTGKYLSRLQTNDAINVEIDYDGFNGQINFRHDRYGWMELSYSYYRGLYDNSPADRSYNYEFSEHTLSGMVHSAKYRGLKTSVGGSYYRSYRDRDTEKFMFTVGVNYQLPYDLEAEVTYRAFNHDNFLVNDQYYTGNIVDFYLIRSFKL